MRFKCVGCSETKSQGTGRQSHERPQISESNITWFGALSSSRIFFPCVLALH
jgi:hypothetical protein